MKGCPSCGFLKLLMSTKYINQASSGLNTKNYFKYFQLNDLICDNTLIVSPIINSNFEVGLNSIFVESF